MTPQRPPIEPLSDLAHARIERRVLEALDAPAARVRVAPRRVEAVGGRRRRVGQLDVGDRARRASLAIEQARSGSP